MKGGAEEVGVFVRTEGIGEEGTDSAVAVINRIVSYSLRQETVLTLKQLDTDEIPE